MKQLPRFRKISMLTLACVLTLQMLFISFPIQASASGKIYRALIIGNNNYDKNPLKGCINDANAFRAALGTSSTLSYAKAALLTDVNGAGLAKAFSGISDWGMDRDDVTVIFYSGHGYRDSETGETGIVGTDLKKYSFFQMEQALSKLNGTIVLLIDSCYSGGAIQKGSIVPRMPDPKTYNQSIHDLFNPATAKSAKAMTSSKYHVITAASSNEYSFESGGNGYFTTGLTEAMGYSVNTSKKMNALKGDDNGDGKLSISEAYTYSRDVVNDFRGIGDQNVQISPIGSTLTLVARKATGTTSNPSNTEPNDTPIELIPATPGLPNLSTIVLAPGQQLSLNNAQGLTWSSSKSNIASVSSNGTISSHKTGKVVLTGKKGAKVVSKCALAVVSKSKVVNAVKLNLQTVEQQAGASFKLSAKVSPAVASRKTIKWYSNNKSVATVNSSGVVSLKKQGSAEIFAIASNGMSDACTITVNAAIVKRVAQKKSKASVGVGKKIKLLAKALPAAAENKKLRWESSNSSVASVDPNTGVVTGHKPGNVAITANSTDGTQKSSTCMIKVVKK